MYVNTPHADPSLQRPIKRLEGFQKVFLVRRSDQDGDVADQDRRPRLLQRGRQALRGRPGPYGIQISTSSADSDIQAQDTINVNGKLTPKPSVLTAQPRISGADAARGISQRVMFPEGVDDRPGPDRGDERRLAVRLDRARPEQAVPARDEAQHSAATGRASSRSAPTASSAPSSNGAATVTATATYNGAQRIDLIRGSRRSLI